METFFLIVFVLAVLGYFVCRRQQERAMERRIMQDDDKALILLELDRKIEQDREQTEFWKKQKPGPFDL